MARSKATIERDRQILTDYEFESKTEQTQSDILMRIAKRHKVSYVTVWRAIKRAKESLV